MTYDNFHNLDDIISILVLTVMSAIARDITKKFVMDRSLLKHTTAVTTNTLPMMRNTHDMALENKHNSFL